MLLDTKVHHLTMLVCSTAHTFRYKWFVRLVKILSNQKSGLKLVMVSLLTHSTLEQLQLLLMAQFPSVLLPTNITEKLKFLTLCNNKSWDNQLTITNLERGFIPLFFYVIKIIPNLEQKNVKKRLTTLINYVIFNV